MSRPTKDEVLRDVHQTAIRQFDDIQVSVRDVRIQCLDDRRFYSIAGAQWEGPFYEQFENKPRFEVNKTQLAVLRIINEYRNNRITVDFIPRGGPASDDLADLCDGMFRADYHDSTGDEACDNAFEEGTAGGIGAWRLCTKYEDEEDEEDDRQRIQFLPIFDADSSVYWDPNAKRQDKSDAKYCFVLTAMSREAYKDEWGDDPATWPKEIHRLEFDWCTPDVVYVAEYYKIIEKKKSIFVYETLGGQEERYTKEDFDEDEGLAEKLAAVGTRLKKEKRVTTKRVRKYMMSGGKVLKDCGEIVGPNIPIIMMYGKRWFIDNLERAQGHVRLAKDPQRLKNMQLSKLGELSIKSSVEKPIFTSKQIQGFATMWAEDDVKDYPYLLVNEVTDVNGQPVAMGPVAYTKPPQVPQAMAALLQVTEEDMRQILGVNPEADKMVSNISGDAIELIQTRLDMQSYIYVSNMAKAMKRCGEVWLGMAREIYVEDDREVKVLSSQMEPSTARLNIPKMDDNGDVVVHNNLRDAKFDVYVDVGPSTVSRRNSTVKSLMAMLAATDDPETKQVLGALIMMNMEGEGLSDVRSYFRWKLLRMGALKPTDEEAKQLEATRQEDPQSTYLKSAAEQAQAEAAKARSGTVLDIARAEELQAKTLKIASEIDANEQTQAIEVLDWMAGKGDTTATTQPTQ